MAIELRAMDQSGVQTNYVAAVSSNRWLGRLFEFFTDHDV